MINGHGNNLYDYAGKIKIDFSSNIAFNNHSDSIIRHLEGQIRLITNYPDPTARILTEKLARHHGVSPSQILVTNGSAEAFYLVAHLFQGANTLICTPAFAEYEDACRVFEHRISFYPLADISTLLHPDRTAGLSGVSGHSFRTLWLGTPNNPDGRITSPETLQAICREYPDSYLVADRAYYTLCGEPTRQTPLPEPNFISIHSLTKAFAIPGLRLGYLIAAPEIISLLSQMRPPWGVNALSLEAGAYILDHYPALVPAMEELLQESRFLQTALSQLDGLTVIPSDCNFFLCKQLKQEATYVKERLITEYGILIRDCSNFRDLSPFHFRIAAQTRPENEALIRALLEILQP